MKLYFTIHIIYLAGSDCAVLLDYDTIKVADNNNVY